MPTYVYACKSCGHRFEKYQSFSESSLVTCPECTQDALRKVFDSVGIVFKGSGFYSTDSAKSETASVESGKGGSASGSASTESGASGSGDSGAGSSGDSGTSASTPAAASAAPAS
ncbi:FmdB family zinc ribbon protein [Brachybacterium sp. GCM10030267]|uniref:FmdB family zinc ribbon protein n=1 Tax=unclassified Brachybacterium TaxID=2623841 RepID=UPI0036223EDE